MLCGAMPAPIASVALDALMLRARFPELTLREGSAVVARVASRQEGPNGVIVLGGVPLRAELPPEVEAGQTLRLRVEEVTAERVTLKLVPPDTQAAAAPPPPPAVPRPPELRIAEPPRRRPEGGDPEAAGVALTVDSAVLGRVRLRIDVGSGGVAAVVETPAGQPYELAVTAAADLEARLADRTGRPASVRVAPRREPFDAYA
jgi:hypothetical protein